MESKYTRNKEKIGPSVAKNTDYTLARSSSVAQDQENENNESDDNFIKVETAEDYKKLSHVEFINEEHYHYCNLCNSKMPNLKSVLDHFEVAHNMDQFRCSSFKHVEMEPDVHDPNHYCKTCEKTFSSYPKYRQHLIFTHHIVFKPMQQAPHSSNVIDISTDQLLRCPLCKVSHQNKRAYDQHLTQYHNVNLLRLSMTSNMNVLPDWNDPNLYCPSCITTFNTEQAFKFHCRNIHYMKSPGKFPNKGLPDINDPNHYCKVCNITFMSRKMYANHCRYPHGMKLRKLFAFPDLTPEMSSPDHYCQTCDKFYSSKQSYQKHLVHVHHMSLQSSNASIEPDVNDPNFYCRPCDKTMRSQYRFKKHLSLIHSVGQPGRKAAIRKTKPDPDDPNHYCRVCKKTYASKSSYRFHVRSQHGVKPRPKKDHSLLPDPLDPNFYCRVCKHSFKALLGYRRHCQHVHMMSGSLFDRPFAHPDADIDLNHPQFYCAKCNKHLKCRNSFTRHLRIMHAIRISKQHFDDPMLASSDNVKFQCTQCNKHLSSKASLIKVDMRVCRSLYVVYLSSAAHLLLHRVVCDVVQNECVYKHAPYLVSLADLFYFFYPFQHKMNGKISYLFRIHNTIPTPTKMNNNTKLDISDLNFHCQSCNTRESSRRHPKGHVAAVHCVGELPRKKNKARPDVDNLNNCCRAYRKTCQILCTSSHGTSNEAAIIDG
ncbi:hypothetical protein MAM1_0014c01398 [Mucor ambiguus]|uniref:C2H2-type domain-containing protein n=1 Tax=Mucor ambiguus TaxID=91626 RepID=A0A0C9M107_9FUNG|nr:hypothetical protein MAM1_0014c01398 [Mucor ambiguus]